MSVTKPSLPKGTRDFSPVEMVKRNYIYDTIKTVFKKYGYAEIQTPSMENLQTLTGKYGDEGDKLIFKILESGDYSSDLEKKILQEHKSTIKQSKRKEEARAVIDYFIGFIANNLSKAVELAEKKVEFSSWLVNSFENPESWNNDYSQILIDYLYSKSKSRKFNKFPTRINYYLSLKDDINLLKKELLSGLRYADYNKISPLYWINYSFISTNETTRLISKKALRYDLTVPFARYVVMHQSDIAFPFKRFQVQPVWRADRPQKGRYREFYQCDADVVGSPSLLNEAEFILIYQEALTNLGLKDFDIKINNRKILSGIAEIIGKPELIVDMTVAIDKLDKIGLDGVSKELLERGFTEADIEKLKPVILLEGSNVEKLESLRTVLASSEIGLKGIEEIEKVFNYVTKLSDQENAVLQTPNANLELDITLARGLNYYTGCIFEVKTNEVAMGSIGGGGRYDDLTGMFGLKDLTGVGISFGADRIYDVLEELNLFPTSAQQGTKVLISNFDEAAELYALPLLQQLREANIASELYPASAKLKKQMSYADAKNIPFVVLIGDEEIQSGQLTLKDMASGEQEKLSAAEIVDKLK